MNSVLTFLVLMLTLFVVGCNNPSGGSVVDPGHAPLLDPPAEFEFEQVRAKNGTANLSWSDSLRTAGYKVYRGPSSSSMTTLVDCGSIEKTTCDLTGLNPALTYYFTVDSSNAAGTTKIKSPIPIRPVTSFDFTSATVGNAQVTLAWSTSVGATKYTIRYGTASGSYSNTTTATASPKVVTGLQNGVKYFFRIVATNMQNGYAETDSEETGRPIGPPAAPRNLSITPSNGRAELDWDAVNGSNITYRVYRGTVSGTLTQIATGLTTSAYIDNSVVNGTEYFYGVIANNTVFDSPQSSEVSVKTIGNFTLSSLTAAPAANQLTLTWPAAVGADQYNIQYGTSPSALTTTITNVTSPRVLSGLTGNTTYYVRVRAINAVGAGAAVNSTNTLNAAPIPALTAPTGFARVVSPGSIALSWNSVAGASSYEVLRGTATGVYTSLQDNIVGNTYTDATALSGTAYYYVVRAYNGYYSAYSSEIAAKPIDDFTITSVVGASNSSLTVTWPAVSGADNYDVRYGTASGSPSATVSNVTSPYNITGLSANTLYYVTVRARNAIGTGTNRTSTEDSARTLTAAPTGLAATSTPGEINLTWNAATGASSYKVFRGTVSGTLTEIANSLVTTSYTDNSVTDGITYYYAVKANNGTDSAFSAETSARSIEAFSITSATAASTTSVTVTWPVVAGAATYDIRYGTATGTYTTTLTNQTSPRTITGLVSGQNYYFRVVARNAVGAGTSETSPESMATTPVGVPTSVTATAGTGIITINWTLQAGAASYKVYRGTATGVHTLLQDNIATNPYVDNTITDGTQYFYVVRAHNGVDSDPSLEVTAKTITPFAMDSIAGTSANSITVAWTNTAGGDLYDVRYGTVSGTYSTTLSGVTSPYTITGLIANTTYYVVVRARNTVGSGASTTTAQLSQKTSTAAPAGLTATPTPGQIALAWTATTGASSYKVYRGTATGVHTLLQDNVVTNSYTDTTVTNGTQYFYVVTAFNGEESAVSIERTAQPIANWGITSAIAQSATSIQVTWPAQTGATAYDVRYGTTSGSYTTTVSNQTSPYTITGLTANTTYYIVVRAKNTVGTGAQVDSAQVSQATATATPTGLAAAASPGQVSLTWTAVSGAQSYKIFRGTSSGSLTEIDNGVTGTGYLDTTVVDGTTYFYGIKSYNGVDSAMSAEVSVQPIGTFTLSSVTPASATSLTITWTAATGATAYDVRYGTATGVYAFTASSVTSAYTLTGLTANTLYYVNVRARNAIGSGTNLMASELNARTATNAPAGLAAVTTTGQVALTWTATTGAASYKVYRGTTTGVYSEIAAGVTSPSYTDTNIVDGTLYYYAIRAFNGADSAYSSEIQARSVETFTISTTSSPSSTSIQVTWGAATGATAYDVRYATSSGGTFTTISNQTSPYTITGLAQNTTYYIKITGRNSVGSGANFTTAESTQITALAAPTGLAATATPGSIALTWNAVAGASSYKVYRGTVSGSLTELVNSIGTNSYTDATVTDGITYFYTVRSFNGADSVASSEISKRTIAAFTISSATPLSSSSIQVTWGAAAGAVTYDVRYGTTSGSYTTTVSNQTSPYTITGLSAATAYYIVVRANNSVGTATTYTSPQVSAVTATAIPSGLTATASPGQVALDWADTTGATSYNIYRGTISGTLTPIATGVNGSAYLDISVTDGQTYFYAVSADNGTESIKSSEVSVRSIGSFSLTAVSAASATSLSITWGAAPGAASYTVRYGTSSGVYSATVANTTSVYTLTGLTANTQYFVSVRAINSVGAGTTLDSNEMNATTATAAPTSLAATATTGQIGLAWTAAAGASSYKIYRGTVTGVYTEIATGVTALTHTDTNITDGTHYYYAVRSFNGSDSAYSNEAQARSVEAFSIAGTTSPTSTSIQVSWPAALGATAYDVKYGTTSGIYTTIANQTSPYTITGLTANTIYYIVVTGRNSIGTGSSATTTEVSQKTATVAPTGLATTATPGSVSLTWNAVTGATSYKVYRSTTSASYGAALATTGTNSYTDNSAANGTTYFYVVQANNGSDSANSNEVTIRPVASFNITSVIPASSTSLTVTWPAVSGAASYSIRYGTTSGTYTTTLTNQTSPTTITGLVTAETYYVVVDAINTVGPGTTYTSSEAVATTAFAAPTGLAATTTPGNISLTWSNVSGATYNLYRSTTSGSYGAALITGLSSASYTDNSVTDGVTYFYVVRADNGAESANSNETSAQSISSFTLSSVTPTSATSVNVTWTAATGAAAYDVRYGTATATYSTTVSGVTSTYALTGLTAGTTYYVVVRARNAIGAGTSFTSNEVSVITSPAAPAGLSATATTGQIALSWTASSSATGYNVYRSTTSSSYGAALITGVAGTTYTDSSVTNGTQYYYVVRASNGTDSVNSSEVTGKSIAAFSITSAVAASSSSITVTFPSTNGGDLYDVRYGTSSGSYATTVSNQTSPYTITGLSSGTTYYIVVRARNTVGSSSSATTAEVSTITPLGPPGSFAATSTPGQVALSWATVSGASSYKIYRSTTSGSYGAALVTGVTGTSYNDTSVTNGTQYYYVIKSFNGSDSANSSEVTTLPMANFSVTSTSAPSATSVQVTWTNPTGAATADVRYGTTSGSYTTTVTNQTSPYTITGLAANTTYYIVVRANNTVGVGTTSVTSTQTSQKTQTAAPSGLTATATTGQVALSWSAVTGATTYKVYRGTSTGVYTEIESDTSNATTYNDTSITDGTQYFYAVKATNGTDSAYSNEATVKSIGAFALSSVVAASSTSLTATWTAAAGADTYDIRYSTTSGSGYTTVTGVTSPYSITGLAGGTTYYVVVVAKNAVGVSGTTKNSSEVSGVTTPGAPTGVSATATTGQIALSWTAANGATSYKVYRSTSSGSYGAALVTGIAGTSYTDVSVANGTQYYYVVTASNGTDSVNSAEVTGKSIAAFTITSAIAASTSSITVTFPATAGGDLYDVRYGTSSGSYATTVSNQTSPYTITGLTSNTTYYIVVRARNTIGSSSSATTPEVSVVTPLAAPSAFAAASTPGQVTLSWGAVSGASSYKIYRSTTSGSYGAALVSGITGTSYNDSGISNGTQYYYVIRSFNGSDSANSSEVTTLPMANFSITSLSAPSSDSVTVTWTNPTGAATADVRYGTTSGVYSNTVNGQTSPYTITGLAANTTYYVVIRANNSIGAGTTVTSSQSSQKTPTGAPTGLIASATPGSVYLDWADTAGATSYKVWRGTSSGSLTELVTGLGTSAYTDASAVNGTTYYYAVKSNNGTDSILSSEVSVQPISTFSLTGAATQSSSRIDLTFGAATGATTYDVRYGTTSGVYLWTVPGVTSVAQITGLTAGTQYYFSVRAKNAIGAGTNFDSNEMNATTSLGAPSGLAAAATPGSVTLTWNSNGATTYKVYRSTTSGSYGAALATGIASTSYIDSSAVNGTIYYYVVRANNGTDSVNSSEVSVKPISSFSLTAATGASSSSVNLTWGAAAGADTYDIRYGTTSGTYTGTATNQTSVATLTSLATNTLYYVAIRANNTQGAGTTFLSNEMSVRTATAAPTSLAISAVTPGQVNLTWTAATGATTYKVYRGTVSGVYTEIANGISVTNYQDISAVNGTKYFYVVRAFNGTESVNSNEVSAKPIASFAITSTTAPSTSSIQVTWPAVAGADAYDVRYSTTSGSGYVTASGVTSPYTIPSLTSNTTYYIVVRARNADAAAVSFTSAEVSQKTPVAAPSGLTATGGVGQVSLSWTAVTGATSYKIWRGTTSGSLSEIATGVVTTTYTDTGLTNGTPYYYAVKTFNGADSALSSEVFKQPIAQVSISSVSGGSSSIIVNWAAATGAASYDLQWGTASGSYTTTVTGATSPAIVSGLSVGTTYYVRIQAKNTVGGGTTVNSAEASGTPNSPPVLGAIATQTTDANVAIAVPFTLTDSNHVLTCAGAMSGSSSNTTVVPNSNIVFTGTVPNCTATITPANNQMGAPIITLTANDGVDSTQRSFTLNVVPCTVASIVWNTQPANVAAGSNWGSAPTVTLRKADNSTCTSNTAPVSLYVSIDNSTLQDATVTGVATVTPVNGVATFSAANMQRAGTGYTLSATQGGINSVDSNTFNVTAGAASKISWSVQPTTSNRTTNILPSPTIQTTDLYGNPVGVNGVSVTISLQNNTGGATLSGTLTRSTNASGVAIFSGLSIDVVGSYFLRATPGNGWPIQNSNSFSIIQIVTQNVASSFEMLGGSHVHSGMNTTYSGAGLILGSDYVDGATTYTWQLTGYNNDTQDSTVRLRSGTTNIASITIPKNTTSAALYSTTIPNASIPTSGNLSLRIERGSTILFSSRILVTQIAASRTMFGIPLTSLDNNTTATPSVSTTSTSMTVPNELNFPPYDWDRSQIARIDSIQLNVTSRSGACVQLFNKDTGTAIGSEICNSSGSDSLVTVDIEPSIMPSTARIEARMRSSSGTGYVNKVMMMVRLVSIEKMVSIQRVAPAVSALSASANFVENRAMSQISAYGGTKTQYVKCRAKANTSGSASFIYKAHGSNTSGIAGSSTITASTNTFTSQSSYTTLEAGPIATTDNDYQYMNYTHTSGAFALSHCLYEVNVAY